MLPSFAKTTVEVTRASMKESRGTKTRDWANATTHEVAGCSFQPQAVALDLNQREGLTCDAVLYAPPGSDIEAADRITHDGQTYTVMGVPKKWESPTGLVSHLEIELETWHG